MTAPIRRALAALTATALLPLVLGAQVTPRPPRGDSVLSQRASAVDTTRRDSAAAAAARDPMTRVLNGFTVRNIGPAAYSGRVTSLAVPRPYRKTIYAGSAGGGVWKTSNGGTTWQPIGDSLGVGSVGDVAVAPSDSSIVWVGTGEKNSLRSQSWGNGVHRSTDGGRTWRHMGLRETRSIGRIVVHPTDPQVVYVAALGHLWGPHAERGVYKSTDGGASWRKVLYVNDTTGIVDLELDPANPEVLYAAAWHRLRWGGSRMQGVGAGSGIYKTTDGGRTWTRLTDARLNNGLPAERIGRIGLAIAESSPRTVYAMVQVDRGITNAQQSPYGGVFRSDDAGATWRQTNDFQSNPHYYYNDIWVDPTNAEHVYVTATYLMESKDGARTFEQDSLHNVHVDHHAMWIDPADPEHVVLGNDGGVYITSDGGKAWDHQQIPIGQFYAITVDSSQFPYHVCGGLQDNGTWCGPSMTRDTLGMTDADWYAVNGGDGMHVQIPWHDPHVVYSEFQFGTMSRLDLRTWKRDVIRPQSVDAGADSGYELRWGWTAPIVLSQHDSTVLYVGSNHLVRLTNEGRDWEVLGPDMTRADRRRPEPEVGHTSYQALFAIGESPRSADVLWTGSDDGLVWVSRDRGKTWANVTANLPKDAPTRCFVASVVPSRHADGTAWMVYDCHHRDDYRPHVYRTTDFGRRWTRHVEGLPADGGSLTIFEDPQNAAVLWVGTDVGLFVTVDGGRRWRRFGRGLPPVSVPKLAMSYEQRDLVIGTHGRGVWITNVGPLEEWSDTLLAARAYLFDVPPATQFRYADTYPSFGSTRWVAPNPARGAQIALWLREAGDRNLQLVVTDAAGDTVRKISAPAYAGLQRVTWDLARDRPRPRELGGPTTPAELRRVTGGEYTLTLKTAGLTLTRKVVVRPEWPPDRLGRVR
ncbi:MAG TPA: hypothetical protein VNA89_14365 [Gemmatimonadaceae bacterium]|nr:hypothetical protein [Gemmatimonadaceae bacterium]